MTVTLLDRAEMAESADLRRRLRQALVQAAADIAAEDPGTENHPARVALASQVLHDPTEWAKRFSVAVANNSNIGADKDDPADDSTDGDNALAWVIASLWDAFAPHWGGSQ